MFFYPEFVFILAAIALVCLVGFKKYVWFISVGYGFSISAVGVCLAVLYREQFGTGLVLSSLLLVLYGLRLGGFLLLREKKSRTYNAKMKTEISDGSGMKLFVKILLWLSCTVLYFLMTSPLIYRFANGTKDDACLFIGLFILLCGIVLEALSDAQKSRLKKKAPHRFCDTGLFRLVRCPNYLGELLIWTGVFVSGFPALCGIGQWTAAIVGYLGIVYVMFSGARRLELRQDRTYGEDAEYRAYAAKTPILLPFVPLYSVKKYKWLVG